ncbi:MAG: DNA polymerase domain-containing protein [Ktedonobacterales bacterium]
MRDDTREDSQKDEWLWGWDATPGIISVWAERDGRAIVWRREPASAGGALLREEARYRPWLLLDSLVDLLHLGARLVVVDDPQHVTPQQAPAHAVTYCELVGPGRLRYLVSAADGRLLEQAVLRGAGQRLGRPASRLADLGEGSYHSVPPDEQYLVATGRACFRGLTFDDLHRLQFDLETTGLFPDHDAIFLIAVRDNRGLARILDVQEGARQGLTGADAEADLLRRFVALIQARDPDVIENHNLHGFDLPFVARRAELLGVPLPLGRPLWNGEHALLRQRPAARGYGIARGEPEEIGDLGQMSDSGEQTEQTKQTKQNDSTDGDVEDKSGEQRRQGPPEVPTRRGRSSGGRYTMPGRELIDTLDAVRRYDFAARDLPGHGLKAVARHFGLAAPDRAYIEGAEVYATWQRDPDRVRHYALDDVNEADGLARLLGGAAFALAQMAPRRYERLADAGPATGILDPLIVRAYVRAHAALPAHSVSDGEQHTGASLYLFASGVAQRIVKADVSSLYPSLMRQYRISPAPDHLGALLALVDRLVEQRLAAKSRAKAAPPGSPERHGDEAISAAMKILVNSAYGYLGAPGLTRLADVHAANEVTRHGRATLGLLCRELAARGATLIEGDTDGVYFAVPQAWSVDDERRLVRDVADLLPPLVRLEFEGRYAAMLSHETKNYALLAYPSSPSDPSSGDDGDDEQRLLLRGVAFHSSRAEPFGEVFLRQAISCLLRGDIPGVQAVYMATADALLRRELPTLQVTTRVRLTKTPQRYLASRTSRREAAYEALLASGRTRWSRGDQVRVYRASGGRFAVLVEGADPRDYDARYYVRLLQTTYAARLARAFTPDDFAAVFAPPEQPSLFAPPLETIHPILTTLAAPPVDD